MEGKIVLIQNLANELQNSVIYGCHRVKLVRSKRIDMHLIGTIWYKMLDSRNWKAIMFLVVFFHKSFEMKQLLHILHILHYLLDTNYCHSIATFLLWSQLMRLTFFSNVFVFSNRKECINRYIINSCLEYCKYYIYQNFGMFQHLNKSFNLATKRASANKQ